MNAKERENVGYREVTAIPLGKWLAGQGYYIKDEDLFERRSLQIQKEEDTSNATTPFLVRIKFRSRARQFIYFGEVNFSKDAWTIKVRGREHVSQMMKLAEDIANEFSVKISVILISELP